MKRSRSNNKHIRIVLAIFICWMIIDAGAVIYTHTTDDVHKWQLEVHNNSLQANVSISLAVPVGGFTELNHFGELRDKLSRGWNHIQFSNEFSIGTGNFIKLCEYFGLDVEILVNRSTPSEYQVIYIRDIQEKGAVQGGIEYYLYLNSLSKKLRPMI